MNERDKVRAVLERINNEQYLGNIRAIGSILVNKEGEIEIQIAMPEGTAYLMISGLEILKYNIMKDIIDNASIDPRERDI